MRRIVPVLLCGGSGTRLWPLSREDHPKQFLKFDGERSLLQQTLMRCARSDLFERPVIVAAERHRELVQSDLAELDLSAELILEPVARNSAAAITVASVHCAQRSPLTIVMAMACDHVIGDDAAFVRTARRGIELAEAGFLLTFGVEPRYPSTSYGYIMPGVAIGGGYHVNQFVEKPDVARASELIANDALWNTGNLLFSAGSLLSEIAIGQPDLSEAALNAYHHAEQHGDEIFLASKAYETAPSISVDHAVMERTHKAAVLQAGYFWSDIGTWNMEADAVSGFAETDENANQLHGDVTLVDCRNNFVHSPGRMTAIVGMEDLIVVNTDDALLIGDRKQAEDVRRLVDELRLRSRKELRRRQQNSRPWGRFDALDKGDEFHVKRITVKTGGVLSLQRHHHRAEHWIVVEGRGEVTIDDISHPIAANDTAYIPRGAVHRLRNIGNGPLVLIEVQTGDYFGEDDIERIEDEYGRV